MTKVTIFIFIVTSFFIVYESNGNFVPDQKFVENVEEYFYLHLVEEFSKLGKMTETRDGRKWLRAWENKIVTILQEILSFRHPETNLITWYSNWLERLQHFDKLNTEFYQKLIANINSRQSWPVRVTFDPLKRHTIVHPDKLEMLDNRIATEADIEEVLKFHRPFTEAERKIYENTEANRIATELDNKPDDFYFLLDDMNGYKHEVEKSRRLVKKYHIINQKMIQNLVEARYKLLKESLKDKSMYELHYQKAQFQVERIFAELDDWNRHDIIVGGDEYFNKHLPFDSRLLNNDEAYRRYMNSDDTIFKGNLMYGYKNRYDDPINHDNDFEVTAKRIIGKRYRKMRELSNDMRQFKILTEDFSRVELKHLPLIESYIERFKTWTFFVPQRQFDSRHWFSEKTSSENDMFMVRPKNFLSRNTKKMYQEVKNTLDEGKKIQLSELSVDHLLLHGVKNFKLQARKDAKLLISMLDGWNIKYKSFFAYKMIHHMNALNNAKFLHDPALSPSRLQSSLSTLEFERRLKLKDEDSQDFVHGKTRNKNKANDESSIINYIEKALDINYIETKPKKNEEADSSIAVINKDYSHRGGSGGDNDGFDQHLHHLNIKTDHNNIHTKHHS